MAHEDHEKNRAAWNDMVEVHYNHPDYKLREFLGGWNSLKQIEKEQIGDVKGKELLHLMCQFGMDTLSWQRLGAKVTGVDISDNSIKYANILKKEAGLDSAEFLRSDVLDLIGKIDRKFDIVFMSHGTIGWLSDMNLLAKVVAHYLKPGGFYYIIDSHPIETIYITDDMTYLDKRPERTIGERDYCDREFIIKKELVEWQHPLSEIINSLIKAGLTIDFLHEYDHGFYAFEADWYKKGDYYYPPGGPPRYPLMFSLKASKR